MKDKCWGPTYAWPLSRKAVGTERAMAAALGWGWGSGWALDCADGGGSRTPNPRKTPEPALERANCVERGLCLNNAVQENEDEEDSSQLGEGGPGGSHRPPPSSPGAHPPPEHGPRPGRVAETEMTPFLLPPANCPTGGQGRAFSRCVPPAPRPAQPGLAELTVLC